MRRSRARGYLQHSRPQTHDGPPILPTPARLFSSRLCRPATAMREQYNLYRFSSPRALMTFHVKTPCIHLQPLRGFILHAQEWRQLLELLMGRSMYARTSTALTRLEAGAAVAKAIEVSPLRATCPDRRPQTAVEEIVAAAMVDVKSRGAVARAEVRGKLQALLELVVAGGERKGMVLRNAESKEPVIGSWRGR